MKKHNKMTAEVAGRCLHPSSSSVRFRYDLYLCPQGYELTLHARRKSEAVFVYQADAATCNTCPVKVHCTNSRSGRHIFRSFYQDYLDQAARYRTTEAYQKALRKRLVWVEPLFGEAKQWHDMMRFRLLGLEKVNMEGVLKAAGQNIKRLLNYNNWWNPKHPARGALLSPYIFLFNPLLHATLYHWALACKGLFQHAVFLCDIAGKRERRTMSPHWELVEAV